MDAEGSRDESSMTLWSVGCPRMSPDRLSVKKAANTGAGCGNHYLRSEGPNPDAWHFRWGGGLGADVLRRKTMRWLSRMWWRRRVTCVNAGKTKKG